MSNNDRYYYSRHTRNCYYSELWQAYIYDYYENDSFPMFGWVKPCYYCNYVGSSFMTRVYMDKTIIIHACRRCIKKHKYNIAKEKVIHKCLKNAIYITPDPEDFIIS